MTIIIDNYDSFTYNLVHIVNEISGRSVEVYRNDKINYESLDAASHIILSPGPGIPDEAGDLKKVIAKYCDSKVLLGVCLGHQAIGEVFDCKLKNLPKVYHGKKTLMHQTKHESPLFTSVDHTFYAGRYHSWVIDTENDLSPFEITAIDDDGEIMALQHTSLKVYGVQFHPESVMTDCGKIILQNFLNIAL